MDANKWFYLSYLLRLWPASTTCCRISLEDAHNGERHGFASLEGLLTFLRAQIVGMGCQETWAETAKEQ
jgi:hypothetical protein